MVDQIRYLRNPLTGARSSLVWFFSEDSDKVGWVRIDRRNGSAVTSRHVLPTTVEVADDVHALHLGAVTQATLDVEDASLIAVEGVEGFALLHAVSNVDHKEKSLFGVAEVIGDLVDPT